MHTQYQHLEIEVVQGNIAAQPDIEAIVNPANTELLPGGGVTGAIHTAAGPQLAAACRDKAPLAVGDAIITDAFQLPNTSVIHCIVPVYGENEPSEILLQTCYQHIFQLIHAYQIRSIALPPLATGVYDFPVEEAAAIAADAIRNRATDTPSLGRVRCVAFNAAVYETFANAFSMELD